MSAAVRSMDAEAITRALRGFTDVVAFALSLDPVSSHYSVRLTLADASGKTNTLLCGDVQNLEWNATGEGFERMPLLRVEDVRGDGLERIHYTVDELESEAIFLHCAEIELLAPASCGSRAFPPQIYKKDKSRSPPGMTNKGQTSLGMTNKGQNAFGDDKQRANAYGDDKQRAKRLYT